MNTESSQNPDSFLRALFSNKKIVINFTFSFLLLLGVIIYTYFSLSKYIEATTLINQRFETLNTIGSLNSSILKLETNQRGFLLTGNEDYLREYDELYKKIYSEELPAFQKQLEKSTDTKADMKVFELLKTNIDSRLTSLQQSLILRQKDGLEAAIDAVKTNVGKEYMEKIQANFQELIVLETKELNQQLDNARKQAYETIMIVVFGIFSATFAAATGYFIIVSEQIKKRKLEKALAESEAKYRLIFESMQDVYYKTDTLGNILSVSPSIEKYIGIKPENLIGKNASVFYLNPKDREDFMKKLMTSGSVSDYSISMRGKNNAIIQVSASSHIVFDDKHNPIAVEGVLRDITARSAMENALRVQTEEAERLNKISVDRELKMIELKKEIAELKKNNS